ncbi:MAG: alpha/beta hydrolase [Acidobacteria bacterium]|nr:alpha/beta hydrolase [Acidobacteriota bacterium]
MRKGIPIKPMAGAVVAVAVAVFAGPAARAGTGTSAHHAPSHTAGTVCPGTGTVEHLDIPYENIPGIDRDLLSLDLYEPVVVEGCPPAPVMVWVHGGAWSVGDKRNKIATKVSFFNGAGWVFISLNYRLSPADLPQDPSGLDPDRIAYPVHEKDVAAALAWVVGHVAAFGGDPNSISLMGHSAGAGIVSTLATDESFLRARGLDLGVIRHAVSLDTAAYDVRRRIETASPVMAMVYLNAFGTDPAVWDTASPINHVAPGMCIPPFFVVTRGSRDRVAITLSFTDALRGARVPVTLLYTPRYDHAGVNDAIGSPDDEVITPALMAFLEAPGRAGITCSSPRPRVLRPLGRARPGR